MCQYHILASLPKVGCVTQGEKIVCLRGDLNGQKDDKFRGLTQKSTFSIFA